MPVPSSCRLCMDAVQSLLVRVYYPIACMVQPFVVKPKADHKKLDQTSVLALDRSWSNSEAFAQAVALVQERGGGLPNATRLGLYALYKQALSGDAPGPPAAASWDVAAGMKHRAWAGVSGMMKEEAMRLYTRTAFAELGEGAGGGDPLADADESVFDELPSDFATGGAVQSRMAFASPADADDEKMPPLHEAVQRGDVHRCRMLLDEARLAVDEADEDGHTALHWACDAGHMEVARCLLEYGAAPNAQNVDGSTPLHMACVCEHLELARMLLELGADGGLRDGDGQSPADLAPAAMIEALQLK